MNRTIECLLLSLIIPATALAFIALHSRFAKAPVDEDLHPAEGPAMPPQIKLLPKRRR
jgi:hypothetical protein